MTISYSPVQRTPFICAAWQRNAQNTVAVAVAIASQLTLCKARNEVLELFFVDKSN